MELTMYQLVGLAIALMVQTAGVTAYIGKIKNDLNTRVAVLEAGHTTMSEDLKEIKDDVKELLVLTARGSS